MIERYGFCSRESVGFLKMLKEKYKFNFNPKVINYDVYPPNEWSIYDSYKKAVENHIIFLNYPENYFLEFDYVNGKFLSNKKIQYSGGISSIKFNLKKNYININSQIKIYKKKYNLDETIYEENINKTIKNNEEISLNFVTKQLNSRWEPIFIEFLDLKEDEAMKINSIVLKLKNQFELENFQIIEQYKNCYYVTN